MDNKKYQPKSWQNDQVLLKKFLRVYEREREREREAPRQFYELIFADNGISCFYFISNHLKRYVA